MSVHEELVQSGGHHIAPFFVLVSSLQQGLQIRVPIVHKFVPQKVGDFKVLKVSLFHEPGQVGGGHSLFRVKGGAVQSSGRLALQIRGEGPLSLLSLQIPAVRLGNLLLGVIRDVRVPGAGIALNAEAKQISGLGRLCRRRRHFGGDLALHTSPQRYKSRFPTLPDGDFESLGIEPQPPRLRLVDIRTKKNSALIGSHLLWGEAGILEKLCLQQGLQICVLGQFPSGCRAAGQLGSVKKIAGCGRRVVKADLSRLHLAPDSGQPIPKVVESLRVAVPRQRLPLHFCSTGKANVFRVHLHLQPKLLPPHIGLAVLGRRRR